MEDFSFEPVLLIAAIGIGLYKMLVGSVDPGTEE